jgi:Flp pilus assembly protein TadG
MSRLPSSDRDHQGGQILVLFALGIVVIIAMVGLVLDGGSAFAQRRFEQTAADLASVAGANAYMNEPGSVAQKTAAARSAAVAAAARNGYSDGVDRADVAVAVELLSSGARVVVDITDPHPNSFARVVGQDEWDVSVTAAATAGLIDTAAGAAPWLMHIDAFNPDGSPKYGIGNPQNFGEINGDFPVGPLDIAWTDFNGSNNVNANEVREIIEGANVVTATILFDQYVGQHNNGNMTALYPVIDANLVGRDLPVPVVGPCAGGVPSAGGCFKGWAIFHVTGATGGSSKHITGYFTSTFVSGPLSVGACTPELLAAGTCGEIGGNNPLDLYVVRLSD